MGLEVVEYSFIEPILFIFGLYGAFSIFSGWLFLSFKYKAHDIPWKDRYSWQVSWFGFVPEGGATDIIISESGLYFSRFILFRFLHPPLRIPWSDVQLKKKVTFLGWTKYDIKIASFVTVRVSKNAFELMEPFLEMQVKENPITH